MGSKVWSVMDVLGLDRIQAFADKLASKTEWDTKQLSLGALRNKPGDPYLDLKWVPEEFLSQSGPILMLTTLGMSWMYSSARACLRCGPHVMPLVGVGTFYLPHDGHSAWLLAWPIEEQVKLGVSMDKMVDFLAQLSLPDMLTFVSKGFHVVLTARRVVWVPYGYNVALVSLNSELELAGPGSKSTVLALPMLSDSMASRDLSQEVFKMLLDAVSSMANGPDAQQGIWKNIGAIYEQWLRSFLSHGHDEDGQEESQPLPETAQSAKSSDVPAMSESETQV